MNKIALCLGLLIITNLTISTAFAQPLGSELRTLTLPYGKVLDWHSEIVNDSFRTYIFFPPAYDTANRSWPVLYLTDGDWMFTSAVNAFGSLKQDYSVEEPVIVAIGYGDRPNQRARDLDPEKGGAAFLQSLKKELIPWVNAHFKVNDNRALYGYSLGGKFATFALFNEPKLFTSVLIGAPADGGRHLLPTADLYKDNVAQIRSKVFLATGEYERETVANIKEFARWIQVQSNAIPITTWVAPAMNHGAAIPAVLQEAIRTTYAKRHAEIPVPLTQLKAYAGRYSSADNKQYFELFVKGGALYIMLHGYTGDFPFQLHATSNNAFFLKEYERILYTFNERHFIITWPDGQQSKYVKSK